MAFFENNILTVTTLGGCCSHLCFAGRTLTAQMDAAKTCISGIMNKGVDIEIVPSYVKTKTRNLHPSQWALKRPSPDGSALNEA